MTRNIETGTEIEQNKDPFIIEICGSPLEKRFDRIVDNMVDYLFKRVHRFPGGGGASLAEYIHPETSRDVLVLAGNAITNLVTTDQLYQGSRLINGSIFEELAYLEFYRRRKIINDNEATLYTSTLLSFTNRVDMEVLILLSPETVLSTETISCFINESDSRMATELKRAKARKGRNIYEPEKLALLNDCFVVMRDKYGKKFDRFQTVDFQTDKRTWSELALPINEQVMIVLSRVYPIKPNIFYVSVPKI